jgi:hypothetical protein
MAEQHELVRLGSYRSRLSAEAGIDMVVEHAKHDGMVRIAVGGVAGR